MATAEQELAVRTRSAQHYDNLTSVYVGNIKRLTFISDGQTAIEGLEPPGTCPFCDGHSKNTRKPTITTPPKLKQKP